MKKKELKENEIALIMFQLLKVIKKMKMAGIAHRDLKPENILIE